MYSIIHSFTHSPSLFDATGTKALALQNTLLGIIQHFLSKFNYYAVILFDRNILSYFPDRPHPPKEPLDTVMPRQCYAFISQNMVLLKTAQDRTDRNGPHGTAKDLQKDRKGPLRAQRTT